MVGNDVLDSGLFLDEQLKTGEEFWSQMAERLGKSQHDVEVVDTLELEAGHPAVLIIHTLLQKLGVKGQNHTVIGAMQKKQRRRVGAGVGYGSGDVRGVSGGKYRFKTPKILWLKGIGPGQPDHAADRAIGDALSAQIAIIESQQCSQMCSGRMTDQHDAVFRFSDIIFDPGHRCGTILHEDGELHIRVEPIIGDDSHISARAQGLADEPVFLTIPAPPAASVKKDQYRCLGGTNLRVVDI